ncbi:MAG TPA: hypothetical protein VM286_02580 [Candidatus Thermoplasmatota archaeon]|nr:hypothetical protein [Candidatus Thermoplasmatota archaeon]
MTAARTGEVERATKETKVTVRLDLDGKGAYDVHTPNPFLTHMLETWTRYAGFDLRVRATGDLDHHLVEDVGIALGQAFRAAFALAPCQRIAYDIVPMDDALVLVAVDLVDRPYYEGQLPIPLWEHFLRSFAMEARINLHVDCLRGRDTHHCVEASMKAFARALRRALEPREDEVSTKGKVQATVRARSPAAPAIQDATPATPPETPSGSAQHAHPRAPAAPQPVARTPGAPPARTPPTVASRPLPPRAATLAAAPAPAEEEKATTARSAEQAMADAAAEATARSLEEAELDRLSNDPASLGWSWREGSTEPSVRKAIGDLEVRHVGKDGRPRLEAKPRKKKASDPAGATLPKLGGRTDAGPLPDSGDVGPEAAHATPASLAAASREVRSKMRKAELPEVKAARERDKEIHGEGGKEEP